MKRRPFYVLVAVSLVLLAASAFVSCHGTGMSTASEMKNSLAAQIPIGTPVADAETRLKGRGFTVSHEHNYAWANRSELSDYLYGNLSETEGLLVMRRWQVAVFHKDGVVTDIDVTTDLTGP